MSSYCFWVSRHYLGSVIITTYTFFFKKKIIIALVVDRLNVSYSSSALRRLVLSSMGT